MPLLQTQFLAKQNDWPTLLVLGAITLVSVIALVRYHRSHNPGLENRKFRFFSRKAFRKQAAELGLSKHQIKMLEIFIKTYSIRRPFDLFTVRREIDNTLGKALRDINHQTTSSEEIEIQKQNLYQIKQKIERNISTNNQIEITRQLRLGQKITFQGENSIRRGSVVLANLREFFCAQAPKNSEGEDLEWKKGTKIKIFIWGISGNEMVFETKILGYTDIKDTSSLMLQHTKRVRGSSNRKFRRRPLRSRCIVAPIRIIKRKGKKVPDKAVLLKDQTKTATMLDVSPGGCSISINRPLPRGELVKIIFESNRSTKVVIYGKIVDVRLIGRSKATSHIMFTRASTKNINLINEYVYNFE